MRIYFQQNLLDANISTIHAY